MHPITISILLGLTAAAANVFGGAIIVQRHWERRYLRYFVASQIAQSDARFRFLGNGFNYANGRRCSSCRWAT